MGQMNSTTINFISRADMKTALKNKLFDPEKTVVISINDSGREISEMVHLLHDYIDKDKYLMMWFADDESDFDGRNAENIFSFIKHHGHKKNYIIHCFAGVSRSGAVAKFINDYFGIENEYLNNYVGHNRHVYNTLHSVAGTDWGCYIEELEKQDRKFGEW